MADTVFFEWFDYAAFPIRDDIPLPEALHRALYDWAREGDAKMLELRPGSPAKHEWMTAWTERGRGLAGEVALALQRPVDYLNELSEKVERIDFSEI